MIRTTTRHLGALFLPMLLLAAQPARTQEGPIKIAVADIERIVTQSAAGQEMARKVEALRQSAEQQLKERADALATLKTRIGTTTDLAQRNQLSTEYERGAIDFQRFKDDKEREGQKLQKKLLAEIEVQLGPLFRAMRDEKGYDLILARTPGITLVVGERVDITNEILERYDALQ